jgi:hypothetical protein
MAVGLGSSFRGGGTRFRLFPELPSLSEQGDPETVWVSPPAGSVAAGPMDRRMYVVDPIGKERPYGYYEAGNGRVIHFKPPWEGPAESSAEPDMDGHFDHLEFGTRQFEQAHAYGTVRFVLDIWENYFGHQIDWHFAAEYDRLEIVFLRGLDNAFAGYGSLEIGSYERGPGVPVDFGLSFDVIAHEVGHLIIYSQVGLPDTSGIDGEYFGFHESAADMVSLVSLMHFEQAFTGLLESSHGNLYSYNRLNRFGEVSDSDQLRLASNPRTLFEFAQGWREEHDLSEPLTGAFFDIWVDVFHRNLVEQGLISIELDDLSDRLERDPDYHDVIQPLFDRAYSAAPEGFARALAEARDYMGVALALTWKRISANRLDYDDVFRAFLAVDTMINNGRYRDQIVDNMTWRGIGIVRVGPRLKPPAEDSHAFSPRTQMPLARPRTCSHSLPYRLRMAHARNAMPVQRR